MWSAANYSDRCEGWQLKDRGIRQHVDDNAIYYVELKLIRSFLRKMEDHITYTRNGQAYT